MCCGGGSKQPQPVSTQVVEQKTEFPEEIKPFITDILGKSQGLFGQKSDAGYQVFPGGVEGRIAQFQPEQTEALEAYKDFGRQGIAGTPLASARPYYESGLSALGGSMEAFGPTQAQQFMNPYQQAVVDIAKREAERSYVPVFQGIGDVFEKSGGFGGSRQAVREAEASRNLQQQLGDIQTRGMQQAFEQGRSAFEQQKAREAAGAGQLFAQGPQAFGQAAREIASLEAAGKQERAEDQRKKNLLYEQFQEEQIYPTRTLQEYQSMVRGFPYQPSIYQTKQNLAPSPGAGQQILGGLGAIGSIYGGMGGFSPGGFGSSVGASGGLVGGLSSLTHYASGGQIHGGLSGIEAHQNNLAYPPSTLPGSGWTIQELLMEKKKAGALFPKHLQKILNDKVGMQERLKRDFPTTQQKATTQPMQDIGDPGPQKFGTPRSLQAVAPVSPSTGRGTATRDISALESGLSSITDDPRKGLSMLDVTPAARTYLDVMADYKSQMGDTKKLADQQLALAEKQMDIPERKKKEKDAINAVYGPAMNLLNLQQNDLSAFTVQQLAKAKLFGDKRQAAIGKKLSKDLGKLDILDKESESGFKNRLKETFWLNVALSASLGFASGSKDDPSDGLGGMIEAVKEAQPGFLKTLGELKDKYATGKEKRERTRMSLEEKAQTDQFTMMDLIQTQTQKLEADEFSLNKKLQDSKKDVGITQRSKLMESELSDLTKMREGLETIGKALALETDMMKQEQGIAATGLTAIASLLNEMGIGEGSTANLTNKSPVTMEKEMVNSIVAPYGYVFDIETGSLNPTSGTALSSTDEKFIEMNEKVKYARQRFYQILKQMGGSTFNELVSARLSSDPGMSGGVLRFDAQGNPIQ